MNRARQALHAQIAGIQTLHPWEEGMRQRALAWVASGAPLYREGTPATPPIHLVSYALPLIQGQPVLVLHRKARMWLPPGGHVDPGEDPAAAALRELTEELGASGTLRSPQPLMLTWTETVGSGPVHTDVSLWFAVDLAPDAELTPDVGEFLDLGVFPPDQLPEPRNPHLSDFMARLQGHKPARR